MTGKGAFRIPPEYARWGASNYLDVTFDLKAITGKLLGLLLSPGGAKMIEFTKK